MIIFYGRTYLPFHITIPKRYDIEKVRFLYNLQSLDSMSDIRCVVNVRFFYFNYGGKIDIYYM